MGSERFRSDPGCIPTSQGEILIKSQVFHRKTKPTVTDHLQAMAMRCSGDKPGCELHTILEFLALISPPFSLPLNKGFFKLIGM